MQKPEVRSQKPEYRSNGKRSTESFGVWAFRKNIYLRETNQANLEMNQAKMGHSFRGKLIDTIRYKRMLILIKVRLLKC